VTVPELRTGLGPYTNCVKTRVDNGGGDFDYSTTRPTSGRVWKQYDNDGGTNGLELTSPPTFSSNSATLTNEYLPQELGID